MVEGKWKTEVKPERKTNPRGWVVCDHTQVIHNPPEDMLNKYIKIEKLLYDKVKMEFNYSEGDGLICDKTGCWLVKKIG